METPNLLKLVNAELCHGTERIAAQGEYVALRRRVWDLELFAHATYHRTDRDWCYFDREKRWRLYDRAYDSPSAKLLAECADDGTGLPLLTAEAREERAGAR